ncbi:MAG: mechanosensitive ion channel domain-containing protein [Candidatus Nanohaloarchaea archaeon]
MSLLSQLINFVTAESLAVRISVTLLILVLGHLTVRIYRRITERVFIEGKDFNRKQLKAYKDRIQYSTYALNAGIIGAALFYLNADISRELYTGVVSALPNLFSIILVAILGIIGVNIFTKLTTDFFKTVGFEKYIRDAGISREITQVGEILFKSVLYLLILQFILAQAGLAESTMQEFVRAAAWSIAVLIAGLMFYGFKDLFHNLASGMYLKNSRAVRPGEQVQIDGETGEIQNVSLFSTEINTQDGYTLMAQNREVVRSKFKFKRSKSDIETLEEIIDYFVADREGYSGPASIEMALDILGYSITQEDIAEKSLEDEEIQREKMMEAVEQMTDGDVKTAWIESESISDLEDEFKAWFNDGGLIVPRFEKSEIFPGEEEGEYALSVGVEDGEVLVVDPSPESGGVYYINKDRLTNAISGHGYIVFAPEGTQAYWRIKKGLIYSDKSYYDELSKALESKLRRIMRQGRILKDVMPEEVEKYAENWRSDEKISRVWRPEQVEE